MNLRKLDGGNILEVSEFDNCFHCGKPFRKADIGMYRKTILGEKAWHFKCYNTNDCIGYFPNYRIEYPRNGRITDSRVTIEVKK